MEERYEDIPCIDCLCLPICKGKLYTPLVEECNMLYEYLELCRGESIYNIRFKFLVRVLSSKRKEKI